MTFPQAADYVENSMVGVHDGSHRFFDSRVWPLLRSALESTLLPLIGVTTSDVQVLTHVSARTQEWAAGGR